MAEQSHVLDDVVLPNGVSIGVEVLGGRGATDVAAGGSFDFDQVGSALSGLAQVVKEAITKVAPDTASVEFGMDLKVEAGKLTALLVSGSGSASLKVTLGWESDRNAGPRLVSPAVDVGAVVAAPAPASRSTEPGRSSAT